MPTDYKVQPGDCMSSIAFANGFFWQTLWNLPENAALKTLRKNQNVLMPGDTVHIPDLTVKQESRPADAQHKFVLKGIPEVLNMRFLDSKQKPRANLDYVITLEGNARRGKLDGDGRLKEKIPPGTMQGKLVLMGKPDQYGQVKTESMTLQLGGLNPVTEVSGIKARLANRGFYNGPCDENMDDATKQSLRAFQQKQGLPVTGEADDATQQALKQGGSH